MIAVELLVDSGEVIVNGSVVNPCVVFVGESDVDSDMDEVEE